jgi:hypothetical protein
MTSAEQPCSQYYKLVKNNEYISDVEYFIKDADGAYTSIGKFSRSVTKEIDVRNQHHSYSTKTYLFGNKYFTESDKIYFCVPKHVLSKITLLKDGTDSMDITDNLTDVYEVVVTFGNNFFKKYNVNYDEITMGFSESDTDTDTTHFGVESVDDLKLFSSASELKELKTEFLKKNGKEYESIGTFVEYVPSENSDSYGYKGITPSEYTFLKDKTKSTFKNSNDIYVLISEITNIKLKKTDSSEDVAIPGNGLDKVVVVLDNDEKRELNVQTSYDFFKEKKQQMYEIKLTKKKKEEEEIKNEIEDAKNILNTFSYRFMVKSNISREELQSITTDNPTTDKPTTDNPTTDNPTTDNPTTDKPTTDKPTTECTMKDNITQFHTLVNELYQKLENRKKKFVSRNLNALKKMFKSETDYDKLTSDIGTLKKTYDELITKFDTEIEYKLFDFF